MRYGSVGLTEAWKDKLQHFRTVSSGNVGNFSCTWRLLCTLTWPQFTGKKLRHYSKRELKFVEEKWSRKKFLINIYTKIFYSWPYSGHCWMVQNGRPRKFLSMESLDSSIHLPSDPLNINLTLHSRSSKRHLILLLLFNKIFFSYKAQVWSTVTYLSGLLWRLRKPKRNLSLHTDIQTLDLPIKR